MFSRPHIRLVNRTADKSQLDSVWDMIIWNETQVTRSTDHVRGIAPPAEILRHK